MEIILVTIRPKGCVIETMSKRGGAGRNRTYVVLDAPVPQTRSDRLAMAAKSRVNVKRQF